MSLLTSENLDLHKAHQSRPKYERLKQYLHAELTAGRLRPGDALPSEQQMAVKLGISRNTVRQALTMLDREGLIRRVQGKGTYVEADARTHLNKGQDIFALVMPQTWSGYLPSLLRGFESACGDLQNRTIVCSTEHDVHRQGNTLLQLMHDKVSGVALLPTTQRPAPVYQVQQLHERGIPLVFCHHRVKGTSAPLVAIPFDQVGRVAGRALLERGHRRVGLFLLGPDEVALEYRDGLREVMEAGGGELPEEFIYYGKLGLSDVTGQREAVRAAVKKMCKRPDRPTAIFCSFDNMAELVHLTLSRAGIRMPEDISLLGFGGMWRQSPIMHELTSVAVDEIEIGRRAVQILNEMRRGTRPLDNDEEIMMTLGITEGHTLGKAP